MREVIKRIIRKLGWDIHRVNPEALRPTMEEGLKWLASQGFLVNTVLDVGASNGCWAKRCMVDFPKADYLLFEPQPVHHQSLDVFRGSVTQKVTLIKKAVGAVEGHTFFDASEPFGGALSSKETSSTIKTEVTTIDASLSEQKARGPFLLKLDTHGFEKGILDGAEKTLEECSVLIIEAYNYRITEEALLFWELCALLSEKGFRPVDLVDVMHRQYDNSLWQVDLIFVRSSWEGFDYITYQ